jgi:hypothetical protein
MKSSDFWQFNILLLLAISIHFMANVLIFQSLIMRDSIPRNFVWLVCKLNVNAIYSTIGNDWILYQSKTNCTSSYLISTRLGKIGLTFLSSKVAKNIQSGKKYISIQQRVQSCFAKKHYSNDENQIILFEMCSFSCVTITNQSIILKIIYFCNEVRIFALC